MCTCNGQKEKIRGHYNYIKTLFVSSRHIIHIGKNVAFECGLFNDKQQSNLTFEQFFSELSNLAKTCQYG